MGPFTTGFLTKLASDLTRNMLSSAGRHLTRFFLGDEKQRALERCVEAGVTAAVSMARVVSKDEQDLVESIFTGFFTDEYTVRELTGLLSGKPPNMIELRESFREAGYVPDKLPGLRFEDTAQAFKAAFVDAAISEPLLREIINTKEIIRQTGVLEEILESVQGLSDFMKSHPSGITIQNGVIFAHDPETRKSLPFSPSKPETETGKWENFYLNRLIFHCNCLDLTELDERCVSSDSSKKSVKISDVFTTLNLAEILRRPDQSVKDAILRPEKDPEAAEFSEKGMLRTGKSDEKQELVPVQAAEACGALDRIVILGKPGGGKTTLVNHLAVSLARKRMGEVLAESALSGWDPETQNLLPARIVLRRFAAWISDPPPRPAEGLVWDYLAHMLEDWSCPGFVDEMKLIFDQQGGVMFFDGLDEVGRGNENSKRTLILETIRKFAQSFPKSRLVVTCREYAYQEKKKQPGGKRESGTPSWRLPVSEFPSVKLALFHPEQIRFFTEAWYEVTGKGKGWDKTIRQSGAEALYKAVIDTPSLFELGQYPLLLTLMAQVHGRDGYLPRDRADLYDRVVTLLLALWETRVVKEWKNACPLEPGMAPGLNIPVDKLRQVLEQAALSAHGRQEKQEGDRSGCADISREELRELLAAETGEGLDRAEEAIRYMEQRSGLILANDNRTFAFPHRTFQEYLTATAIVKSMDDYEVYLKECLSRDLEWWREVFLLAAGYCRERARDIYNLVEVLLPHGPESSEMTEQNTAFACLAAQAMGETRFLELASTDKGKKDGRFQKILHRVRNWLVHSMRADDVLTPKQRCEAGDALNHIGDPRFDPENGYLPAEPDFGFIRIPAGKFLMGSDSKRDKGSNDEESPQHELELPEYHISRYPVTVGQFRAFCLDSGYEVDDRDYEKYNAFENHPVVDVSWHDAQAYCQWLTEKLERFGWIVRLPTEAEWEKAARGTDGKIFPWGDDMDTNKLNCMETGIGTTSSPGCFPGGASPYGCEEMAGNVWEWTRSLWGKDFGKPDFGYPYDPNDGREDMSSGSNRVVRGGSWGFVAVGCRSAYRYWVWPGNRGRNHGFRLVCLPGQR